MDRNGERPVPSGRGMNSDASLLTPTEQAIQEKLGMGSRSGRRSRSKFKRLPKWLLAVVGIAVVLALGWLLFTKSMGVGSYINNGRYQAVFFTNGQVYFGKLSPAAGGYLKLTEVFYLQSKDATNTNDPQTTTNDSTNVELIKLGSEVHGPEDAMIVSRDQVLFFENLKTDGTVAKSIEKYNQSNNR